MSLLTLVVAVTGPESIWLLADRRLSRGGRPVRDDARKIMTLETRDGVALLGYAGLGATALRTEPADWMSAVLRGRNFPLKQSLDVLAEAMKKQLPRHLVKMPLDAIAAHNVIVPAFLDDKLRLYSIDLEFAPDRKSYRFRYTRHVAKEPSSTAPPTTQRFALGGSGAHYAMKDRERLRTLLRIIKAHDRGKVSALGVADQLAALNNDAHLAVADKSVGPRCIVVWRYRKGGVHGGGGGLQYYSGKTRDASSPGLPAIACGQDIGAIAKVFTSPQSMSRMESMLAAMERGEPIEWPDDTDEINAALARFPHEPDEKLR